MTHTWLATCRLSCIECGRIPFNPPARPYRLPHVSLFNHALCQGEFTHEMRCAVCYVLRTSRAPHDCLGRPSEAACR
jgi:hypothetical protein